MEEKEKENLKKKYREYQELSCPGFAQEAKISALPKHRQTISLRFHAVKKKVCKPFAIK